MALLPVDEALARLLDGAEPHGSEDVPLADAAGRVLAENVIARRTQPPFEASAMDGYAVRAQDIASVPARLALIGMAAAGHGFHGAVGAGQAVRIFTGAPLPQGADTIAIQENVASLGDRNVEVRQSEPVGRHIRQRGLDFAKGDVLLEAGRTLDAGALSLAAAGNHASLPVLKRPLVAIIATGDELVPPGAEPEPDQIVASNNVGVAAVVREAGGEVLDLGIAPDRKEEIDRLLRQASEAGAQLVVTIGGASVGDHDLVQAVLREAGMALDFWKIAMRPGKPLMFGRLGGMRCVGLPGNPVASLVCGHVFLKPLVARLAGRPHETLMREAVLGAAMAANDTRQDYVRASAERTEKGLVATPFPIQDSSMLRFFAAADALIVRPPFAPAAEAGERCPVLMLKPA
ncbi:MAG TPA: gephyrin-like molybdotransferase Glp [Mesorhizobium sp.]|jgi:molybdopterin molybdotransferase|nr:gephyrin-like molybdotransferase Glp [Mesorhizobium sp.]